MVNRWTITDGNTTMTFKFNPVSMDSPHIPKDITAGSMNPDGSFPTIMSPRGGGDWNFNGNLYRDEEYNKLVEWHEKDVILTLTDHLLRSWRVVSSRLNIVDRRPTAKNSQRYEYTWTVINLGREIEESS
jgi:hypothetical protein